MSFVDNLLWPAQKFPVIITAGNDRLILSNLQPPDFCGALELGQTRRFPYYMLLFYTTQVKYMQTEKDFSWAGEADL